MSKAEQSAPAAPGKNAAGSRLAEWAQQYSVEATPLGRGSFASVSNHGETLGPRARESSPVPSFSRVLSTRIYLLFELQKPRCVFVTPAFCFFPLCSFPPPVRRHDDDGLVDLRYYVPAAEARMRQNETRDTDRHSQRRPL